MRWGVPVAKYLTHTACDWRKVPKRDLKGEPNVEHLVQQYLVQLKYDGVCAIMLMHDDYCEFLTRTGESIYSVKHVADAALALPFDVACGILAQNRPDEVLPEQRKSGVYIGELWHPTMDQPTISGASRRLLASKDSEALQFVVFDFLTWEEYNAGGSDVGYSERVQRIEWMTSLYHPDDFGADNVFAKESPNQPKAPPIWRAGDEGLVCENAAVSLMALAQEAKDSGGYDGIICRDPMGTYKVGDRNGAIIKVKPDITVDVLVTGMVEGKGKYVGTVGALVCEYNGKEFQLSGMSDKQRDDWWDASGSIVGKIVEVEAMEISKHGVLREPRFKGVRFDSVREEEK